MITFIILTRNNPSYLEKCLSCLNKQTWQCWNAIVIDTSILLSALENEKICSQYGEKVNHWEYAFESGFAAKNNMGIQEALKDKECKFVCLLNDDAYIEPYFVEQVINQATKYQDAYAFSPLYIFDKDKETIQVMGGSYFTDEFPCGEAQLFKNTKLYAVPKETLFTPIYLDCGYGAAIIYRKEVFEKIGFLDEVFKHGFDEPDFAKRMKAKGLKVMYVPAVVFHVCGGSQKNKSFIENLPTTLAMNRAYLYFLLKHFPMDIVKKKEIEKLKSVMKHPKGLLLELYSIWKNIWSLQEARMAYHELYDAPAVIKKELIV